MSWEAPGYVAEDLVGFGAHGEVWRGRELATGDRVALKRLRARPEPAELDRLRHALAVLAAFRHPHAVRLRGVLSRRGGLVLVLDYAAGGTLGSLIARRGPLEPAEVGALLGPIAAALGAAHPIGLLHGGVSGANVLLTADGRPLLADLGTAGLLAELPAGPESDVYALAALAVQALTGSSFGDEPVSALRSLPETLPLFPILQACLAADPDARPSALDLAGCLRAAAVVAPAPPATDVVAPVRRRSAPTAVAGRHRRDPATRRLHRPARRIGVLWAAAVTVLLAALSGWALWPAPPPAPRRAPAQAAVHAAAAPAAAAPAAAAASWSEVWAALDKRRAQAFALADATLLGEVYLPGCPSLPADLHAVRALAARQAHATGVVHDARSVRVEMSEGATVTLMLVDRMRGYDVRDAAGRVLSHTVARADRRLRVRLARTPGGWRIAELGRG